MLIGSDVPPANVTGKAPPVVAELKTMLSVVPSNPVNGIVPPPPPDEANVTLSPLASVVSVIPVPATKVKVSVAPSATTFDCPDTAIFLKASVTVPPPATRSIVPSES